MAEEIEEGCPEEGDLLSDLLPASEGAGPLLQRDYWGVLQGCDMTAPEVMALVRERFLEFPPKEIVVFRRAEGAEGPLEVGEELGVKIRMAPDTAVRVVHVDDNSLTLCTKKGHPEAGRITFGAYRNDRGDLIFHIRSRARSSSSKHLAGFLALGEAMQTNTWTDFIDCLAHTVCEGIIGAIQAETVEMDEEEAEGTLSTPTFIARGE